MPKVPTLESPRIQEGRTNIQRLDAPGPNLNVGQGLDRANRAARNLNSQAQKIEREEQSKADQIKILEADQKLSELETKLLYDPQSGAMNARGKDSFSLGETVLPSFQQSASEIEKDLNNDFQKLSFRKMMAQRTSHIDRQISRHVSAETKKHDEQVTKSYVANEMNAAIQNFHDPERIKLSLDRQKGTLMSYADRNGLDAETAKQMLSETESKTHSQIVSKLMNGGGIRHAQKYYADNKNKITGEDRISVEKALKAGVIQADSQSASDKIMAKNPSSMTEALVEARKISDPDKRDETVRRVKSRFADIRAAEAEDSRQSFEMAYNSIEANRGDIDSIPKDIWANMAGQKRETIKKIAAQMRNGLPVETDIATYYELETLAGSPSTRKSFMQMNLLEKKHLLSESDFKHFAKMQANARSGKGNKDLDGIQTKGAIVNSALAAGGVEFGKNASPEDNKTANLFRRKVDELVIQNQESTGKKITNEELRNITENLMVESITDNGYFGFFKGRKRLFELTREDTPLIQLEDIPSGEVEEIKSALRNLNMPVNDDNILRLYTEKLNTQFLRGGNG